MSAFPVSSYALAVEIEVGTVSKQCRLDRVTE